MIFAGWYHFISWRLKNITYSHFNIIRSRVLEDVQTGYSFNPRKQQQTGP